MSHILVNVAWPYANGPRHIGHVAGFGVPSDVYARYERMKGNDVLMVSGTDEHGTPILVEADKEKYEGHVDQYENDQYMNRMYAAYGYTDYITPQYYVPSGYRGVSHILLDVDDTLMETYTNLLATYEEQQDQIEAGEEVTEELVTLEQVEAAKQAIIDSVQPTIDEINQKLAEEEPCDVQLEYVLD